MTWNNGRVGQDRQPGYGFGLRSQGDFDPRTDLAILAGSIPSFLHVAGDGNTPTIGPALTTTGTITEGSPIVLASGGALRTDKMSGTSYRLNAADLSTNPAAGEDLVVAWCGKLAGAIAATNCLGGTFRAAPEGGWQLYRITGSTAIRWYSKDDGLPTTGSGTFTIVDPLAPVLLLVKIPFGAQGNLYSKPADISAVAASPGNIVGLGIGVGCRPYAGSPVPLPADSLIAWQAIWHGVGIADLWTAERIARLYALAGVA